MNEVIELGKETDEQVGWKWFVDWVWNLYLWLFPPSRTLCL
jgi:hypothetical protein